MSGASLSAAGANHRPVPPRGGHDCVSTYLASRILNVRVWVVIVPSPIHFFYKPVLLFVRFPVVPGIFVANGRGRACAFALLSFAFSSLAGAFLPLTFVVGGSGAGVRKYAGITIATGAIGKELCALLVLAVALAFSFRPLAFRIALIETILFDFLRSRCPMCELAATVGLLRAIAEGI